jgi:hypothetical protein
MPDNSTPRTLRHQQRHQFLNQVYALALARHPDIARFLGTEVASIIANDETLAATFADLFDPRKRATPTQLTTNPLLTSVLNAQASVLNGQSTVLNGSLPGVSAALTLPTPSTPLSQTLSPPSPTGRGNMNKPSIPTAVLAPHTLADAKAVGARRPPDECFERLCDGLYPGFNGQYNRIDSDTRGRLNNCLAKIRAKMDEQGVPVEERPDLIVYAIKRLPNIARNRTTGTLVKHWAECIAGADRNGRDNGTVHTRYLNETAKLKHQSKLNLE